MHRHLLAAPSLRLTRLTHAWRACTGLWDFCPDADDVGVAQSWHVTGVRAVTGARLAAVPGSWNEQFADLRDYLGPCWYSKRVSLPHWMSSDSTLRRFLLRIGSASYAADVYVSGELVCAHEGGHLPFQCDVSPLVGRGGDVVVAIRVEGLLSPERVPPGNLAQSPQQHPNISLDFFPFCGLHREVALVSLPSSGGIADITFTTTAVLPDTSATCTATVVLEQPVDDEDTALHATLRHGQTEHNARAAVRVGTQTASLIWHLPPGTPLWSPSSPALHDLHVQVARAGAELDSYTLSVGIRTVAVSGNQLLLNNAPLTLRGFGKHEDAPLSGRGLNLPAAVKDAELMRWTGANSYRTAHYPHSEQTLDIADRMGLAVIGETPACYLCFHDGEAAQAARLRALCLCTRELICRDKNRACVLMWSLANEPESNAHIRTHGTVVPPPEDDSWKAKGRATFETVFSLARSLDATRPLTLAAHPDSDVSWVQLCDVVCTNRYQGWYSQPGCIAQGAARLAAKLDAEHGALQRPFMLTEFGADAISGMHADPPEMWSEEYQVDMLRAFLDLGATRPWLIGFHVWNLTDFKTTHAIRRPGGVNHKGVFTRDRRPKMAAHFLRSRWLDGADGPRAE